MPRITRPRSGRGQHVWWRDACVNCGLRRREEWLLDDAARPVLAVVWTDRRGDLRVQPFPPMTGVVPDTPPSLTVAQSFSGVPVGGEPPCRSR